MSRKLTESFKKIIAHKQQYKCLKCDKLLPPSFQIDHIIPFSISKDDSEQNLQALCPNCHSLKTQRENNRINKFKSLLSKCPKDTSICWFCLETSEKMEQHTCSKEIKDIQEIILEQKKTLSTFEDMISKNKYAENDLLKAFYKINLQKPNNVLNVKICLYNLCVYVDNMIYKIKDNDILPSDVGDAISFATRSKKYCNKIDTIEIDISHNVEEDESFEISKNECFDYLSEVLLDYVPEFILSKDNYVSLILV